LPNSTVLLVGDEASRHALAAWAPVIETMSPLDGKPTAYLCENYACRLPTNQVAELIEALIH
jgi:uncharacterized protein YyaL (SSP411 family)